MKDLAAIPRGRRPAAHSACATVRGADYRRAWSPPDPPAPPRNLRRRHARPSAPIWEEAAPATATSGQNPGRLERRARQQFEAVQLGTLDGHQHLDRGRCRNLRAGGPGIVRTSRFLFPATTTHARRRVLGPRSGRNPRQSSRRRASSALAWTENGLPPNLTNSKARGGPSPTDVQGPEGAARCREPGGTSQAFQSIGVQPDARWLFLRELFQRLHRGVVDGPGEPDPGDPGRRKFFAGCRSTCPLDRRLLAVCC